MDPNIHGTTTVQQFWTLPLAKDMPEIPKAPRTVQVNAVIPQTTNASELVSIRIETFVDTMDTKT